MTTRRGRFEGDGRAAAGSGHDRPADTGDGDQQRQRLRLICRGVVQGVGFRPAAHRLAQELGLVGSLGNVSAGVELLLEGSRPRLEEFVQRLPGVLPAAARPEPWRPEWLPASNGGAPQGLTILAAAAQALNEGLVATSLAADRAPCADCLAELADPADRRHGYPFISCSVCGPRYSIASAEPFCRAHTTLAGFPLCPACRAEFQDPGNRRFHAETIGCADCGPQLRLLKKGTVTAPATATATDTDAVTAAARSKAEANASAIAATVALLRSGAIVALQGVGGFQLLVNAADAAAVQRLRQRKQRPSKPMALLVDHPDRLTRWLAPSAAELAALRDPAAPIVLIPCRDDRHERELAGVAPGAAALGVMMPASPLHRLLAEAMAAPLVATSGNRSGEPLCIDPDEALERLAALADAFLVHDRPIARALDDSLLQLIEGRPALLRRSRGFAPEPLPMAQGQPSALLALGGDLKSAPALAMGERVWLAPHLGDLEDRRCQRRLRRGVQELLQRHGDGLEAVVADPHPAYRSQQLAAELPLPQRRVLHHLAHAGAVAAEHRLEPPLLACCADGLGYGAPLAGHGPELWGCELLHLSGTGVERMACLRPLPLPGGDRAMREPRRVALGLLQRCGAEALRHAGAGPVRAAFDAAERILLLRALEGQINSPECSSLGRLFDAAASLLGLCQRQHHEGQAAGLLQSAASGVREGGMPYRLRPMAAEPLPMGWLDWQPLLLELLADRAGAVPAALGAWRFQEGVADALVAWLVEAARRRGGRRVLLAGGCFQNAALLQGVIRRLRAQALEPFWAEAVPGNDGGLALGQVWMVRQNLELSRLERC